MKGEMRCSKSSAISRSSNAADGPSAPPQSSDGMVYGMGTNYSKRKSGQDGSLRRE